MNIQTSIICGGVAFVALCAFGAVSMVTSAINADTSQTPLTDRVARVHYPRLEEDAKTGYVYKNLKIGDKFEVAGGLHGDPKISVLHVHRMGPMGGGFLWVLGDLSNLPVADAQLLQTKCEKVACVGHYSLTVTGMAMSEDTAPASLDGFR